MTAPLPLKLEDEKAERVRQSHHKAIVELQALPIAAERVLPGIRLAPGVATAIAHGLDRAPTFVDVSVPRGAVAAGYINETRDGIDHRLYVVLTATGYGATITVDVSVR